MKILLAILAVAAFARVDAVNLVTPFSAQLTEIVDLTTNGPQMIVVRGTPTGNRFDVNIQDAAVQLAASTNVPLTISARFAATPSAAIVRNSLVQNTGQCVTGVACGAGWRAEQRAGEFPFVLNQEFELAVVIESSVFQIFVNGRHFANYNHVLLPTFTRFIEISGAVDIRSVEVRRLVFFPPGVENPGPGPNPEPNPDPNPGPGDPNVTPED